MHTKGTEKFIKAMANKYDLSMDIVEDICRAPFELVYKAISETGALGQSHDSVYIDRLGRFYMPPVKEERQKRDHEIRKGAYYGTSRLEVLRAPDNLFGDAEGYSSPTFKGENRVATEDQYDDSAVQGDTD